jgi:hypothetical protein
MLRHVKGRFSIEMCINRIGVGDMIGIDICGITGIAAIGFSGGIGIIVNEIVAQSICRGIKTSVSIRISFDIRCRGALPGRARTGDPSLFGGH